MRYWRTLENIANGKSGFNPVAIIAGASSTLTVKLINPNATVATLTAPLIDTLPLGLVIGNLPNPSTTCGGTGVLTAIAGGTSVSLGAGATIPANGFCSIMVAFRAASAGIYVNTLNPGALVTSNGNNTAPAQATLTVGLVPTAIVPTATVPTLSTWAILMSIVMLLVIGAAAQRRRVRQS